MDVTKTKAAIESARKEVGVLFDAATAEVRKGNRAAGRSLNALGQIEGKLAHLLERLEKAVAPKKAKDKKT